MRFLVSALSCALAWAVAGCVEIHETIRVGQDGTVRYTLEYGLPDYVVAALEEIGPADPADTTNWMFDGPRAGVVDGDSVWTRSYLKGDWRYLVTEREVSSLARFAAISRDMERDLGEASAERDSTGPARNEAMGLILSGYKVDVVGPDRLRLRRLVLPPDTRRDVRSFTKAPLETDEPSPEATKRMFAGRTYQLRLIAPRVLSSSGTPSTDRTSVTWSIPMDEASDDSTGMLEAVVDLSPDR